MGIGDMIQAQQDAEDAARYRALAIYLSVKRDEPGDWTCWLELDCIPYRSQTEKPHELVDMLVEQIKRGSERTSATEQS